MKQQKLNEKEKDIKHAVRFNQSTKKSTYIQKYRRIQNNQ